MLLATANEESRTDVISGLREVFTVKDLGVVQTYLGAHVTWGDGICKIDQRVYVDKMVKRFSMEDAKPTDSPMSAGLVLTSEMSPQSPEEQAEMDRKPYRSLTGSLLYASLLTRPDIAFPTHAVCRFNATPGQRHWKAAKRILKYLKATRCHGIVYKKGNAAVPVTYSDSDWGDDSDTRKSQSGWCVVIASGLVDWSTKAQKTVSLSSCEAEYVAASEAFREVLWIKQLLIEMDVLKHDRPLKVRMDSTSAMAVARNPVAHQRTKHIDIKHHFIRDLVATGIVELDYVPTDDNLADVFTKAVSKATFLKLGRFLVQN